MEYFLFALLVPQALLGGTVILFIAKPKDGWTNRINHLKLVWLALAYPSRFVQYFPWLKSDVNEG